MRIVDFLTIVFGASLTSVHSKPAYGHGSQSLTDDIIRVKKRNEESTSGYLEQCGPVEFPMAQRGVVNVLAFLDSSWPYSHRQAIMLKMLKDRLRRSGLPDALFFVVNVDPSFLTGVEASEDDVEKEAWLGVSPEEIDSFSDIDKTVDSLELSMTPDIRLIQDNEHLGIWKNLRGSRDQVLVIDRCGKLTYQVIVPWSILHFPYVKAAILSTYKDAPCGPCDIVRNATGLVYKNEKPTTMVDSSTRDYFQNDRASMIFGDLPVTTESYFREKEDTSMIDVRPENFASSTSGSIQDTNEETSIGSFLEIHITTESTTMPNLISEGDNYTAEFNLKMSDEFKTSPAPMSLSEIIYRHNIEDAISASTSDTTDSINATNSVSTTEDTLSSSEKTIARLSERDKNVISNNFNRVVENIGTTASSQLVTDLTSDSYVLIIDTVDSKVEATTEETLISSVDEILSSKDRSMNETGVEKNETAISSSTSLSADLQVEYSSLNYECTEETIDRTTEETLRVEEDSEKNRDSHLPLRDDSKKNEETEETGGSFRMPIRIIMHAPHFHVDGESTRMHEYLVLKTGSPDGHGHLASRDATRLYSGPQDFHEKSDALPKEEVEAKLWAMTNVIYNKNESPGLYGEVADFWTGTGSQEVYADTEDTPKSEDQEIAEEAGAEVELWKKPYNAGNNNPPETVSGVTDKSSLSAGDLSAAVEATGASQADVMEKNPTNIEEFNVEEEETRNRLIAHYSKLLPWIYYVLDK